MYVKNKKCILKRRKGWACSHSSGVIARARVFGREVFYRKLRLFPNIGRAKNKKLLILNILLARKNEFSLKNYF